MNPIDQALEELLSQAPAVAVLTLEDAGRAVPLAETLAEAGLEVLEITLRTPAALEAIGRIAELGDRIRVGAGTVLNADDLAAASDAGAAFAVSPGATPSLLRAAAESPLPLLPGVSSASDVMHGLEAGRSRFKFFPAEPAGGIAALKALAGPFPRVRFCPTGGIDAGNAADYRRQDNVMTVGGSWMAPRQAIEDGDWDRIGALARDCVNLLGGG